MFNISDTRKDIAIKITKNEYGLNPLEIKRFTNGYCHSVYYVKIENNEFVIRITGKEEKEYYLGSIKWLTELDSLGIPAPKLLKYGKYDDILFSIITHIKGKDLGEVYQSLNDNQKKDIVKELSIIQNKIKNIESMGLYGYPYSENNQSFVTWIDYLKSLIKRSNDRIKQNGIFNIEICNKVIEILNAQKEYFDEIKPIAFLDDITTKNVLVNEDTFSGIVDIDEICFGDSLLVIGLTNMALISMGMDTNYIEYWLEEINANTEQRKVVLFYTLLFCLDFMGEQGMRFNNKKIVDYDQNIVDKLNCTYNDLVIKLKI